MKTYLLGLFTAPALWALAIATGILRRAVRDTVKWRWRHFKGAPKWQLVAYYPVFFWGNLKNQTGAWWNGYERESTPVEPS